MLRLSIAYLVLFLLIAAAINGFMYQLAESLPPLPEEFVMPDAAAGPNSQAPSLPVFKLAAADGVS